MNKEKSNTLLSKEILKKACKEAFLKLKPQLMFRNPVMFTVEIGTCIMLYVAVLSFFDAAQYGNVAYNIIIFILLLLTLLFANFAEAVAEARGKAQAESLRKTRQETSVTLESGQYILSSELKKGDVFICEAGDTIPSDGEIIEGLATIDESAITGESAPVIREAGGDKSSVTGGTKVLSDKIKVLVTAQQGESFLDKMIALVEGANRQKTPNEIALTILLAGFTIVFVIVTISLKFFADFAGIVIPIASLISLFVCLIPTTIGGLLSAIGIAGMDRALRANIVTKSGKAVETAGDVDVLLLDKTGTITIGNRKATHFHIEENVLPLDFFRAVLLSSVSDETPEGKSVVELALKNQNGKIRTENGKIDFFAHNQLSLSVEHNKLNFKKFTAETRSSGVDYGDLRIRKGASDAVRKICENAGNKMSQNAEKNIHNIAANGGTPLLFSENEKVLGVI